MAALSHTRISDSTAAMNHKPNGPHCCQDKPDSKEHRRRVPAADAPHLEHNGQQDQHRAAETEGRDARLAVHC